MFRPIRLVVSLCWIALVLPSAWGSPATGSLATAVSDVPQVDPANPRSEEEALDALAAEALVRDWGVPLPEAERRILQQPYFERIALRAMEVLGDSYAGVWIDHANGGAVVINSSTPLRTSLQLHTPSDMDVRIQRVSRTLSELRTISEVLSERLTLANTDAPVPISTGVSVALNRIDVNVPTSAKVTPAQSIFVKQAQTEFGNALHVVDDAVPIRALNHDGPSRDCDRYTWDRDACDNPLRGGVRIHNTILSCTSGFNANSMTNGLPYLITAGHCLDANGAGNFNDPAHHAQMWRQRMHVDWSDHNVGPNHSHRLGAEGDMAILHVDNPGGWGGADGDPDPWVVVLSSEGTNGAPNTAENFQYYLDGIGTWADVGMGINGGYICSTGDTTGTRCGQITAINQNLTYSGRTVLGLAEVNYRSCRGDSGGPVFKNRLAFGITVAAEVDPLDVDCGAPSYYQGASGIQTSLNVWILTRSRD